MSWEGWTDEKIAEARRLYVDEGMGATDVATAIGAPSRNSVCGKAARMGWNTARSMESRKEYGRLKKRFDRPLQAPPLKSRPPHNPLGTKHRQPKPNQDPCVFGTGVKLKVASEAPTSAPLPTPPARLVALAETSLRLSLLELTSQTCKFSTREEGGSFLFCGHPVKAGTPYCSGHCAVSFTTEAADKRKRARDLVRSVRRYAA